MNYNYIFPIWPKTIAMVVVLVFFLSHYSLAQEKEKKEYHTPYELMSSYYNQDFHPFKKRNVYIGMAFGLEDRQSIEISQNIHNHWQLGTLDEKIKLQKLVFPEGIVVHTKNRRYLTSKVNSLFLLKSRFVGGYEGINKKLPTKNGEESYLVDKRFEISNLDLMRDTT